MRISDGSSDVCSSDLRDQVVAQDLPWRGRSVDDEAVHGIGTFQPRLEKGARNENGQVLEIGGGIVHRPLQIADRSEEHTSELQSLMRISYAVFCLNKKKNTTNKHYKYTTIPII